MFTAAIKFRKSPFDLSTSHHAHQEMVKGLTTEMSGTTLAIMNIAEYYEMVPAVRHFQSLLYKQYMVELDRGDTDLRRDLLHGNAVG